MIIQKLLVTFLILVEINARKERNNDIRIDGRVEKKTKMKIETQFIEKEEVKVIIKTKNINDLVNTFNKKANKKIYMTSKRAKIVAMSITKEEYQLLQTNSNIERIELDAKVYALHNENSQRETIRRLQESIPWGIPTVLQDVNHWKGLTSPKRAVKICIVDTGYELGHEDLPQEPNVNGTNNTQITEAWKVDLHGHGTHVAGTVAAIGENNVGIVGVIPNNQNNNFQLLIGKALDGSGAGTIAGTLEAVDLCIDQGANILSMSLGTATYSKATEEYYLDLYQKGILIVSAAGNDGTSAYSYPASLSSVISVAAVDSNINKATFSQFNNQVEIAAPGVAVQSTYKGNTYGDMDGTSMATPHVAGVLGLLWMQFPQCSNHQLRNVMMSSSTLGDDCNSNTGYGLVQALDTYNKLLQGECSKYHTYSYPEGGCDQIGKHSIVCSTDSMCDDNDQCTIDTCNIDQGEGQCTFITSCSQCAKQGHLRILITPDDYGIENTWNLLDGNDVEIRNGGPFAESKLYSIDICLNIGTYKFTLFDAFDDGMCCQFGNGSFTVILNGEEIKSGAGGFSADVTSFEVFSSNNSTNVTISPVQQTSSPSHASSFESSNFPSLLVSTPLPSLFPSTINTTSPTLHVNIPLSSLPSYSPSAKTTFAPSSYQMQTTSIPTLRNTQTPTLPPQATIVSTFGPSLLSVSPTQLNSPSSLSPHNGSFVLPTVTPSLPSTILSNTPTAPISSNSTTSFLPTVLTLTSLPTKIITSTSIPSEKPSSNISSTRQPTSVTTSPSLNIVSKSNPPTSMPTFLPSLRDATTSRTDTPVILVSTSETVMLTVNESSDSSILQSVSSSVGSSGSSESSISSSQIISATVTTSIISSQEPVENSVSETVATSTSSSSAATNSPPTTISSSSSFTMSSTASPTSTTVAPTEYPSTLKPSKAPLTTSPTKAPFTTQPSEHPFTMKPSKHPVTTKPTELPTRIKTESPTIAPTDVPTIAPTTTPTEPPSTTSTNPSGATKTEKKMKKEHKKLTKEMKQTLDNLKRNRKKLAKQNSLSRKNKKKRVN